MSEAAIKRDASQWPLVSLGSICQVIAGQSPPGSAYNSDGQGLPFYQGKKEFTDRFLAPPTKWTTEVTRAAEPKDFLMSVRAPVGPINEATETICIGRGLAAIRAGDNIDQGFLWYALLWLQPEITGNDGAVFPSINKKQIESLVLPCPSVDEQKQIVAILDQAFAALDRARAHAESNLADAQALFDGAIHSLFRHRSAWKKHELGSAARFIDYRGKTPPKSESGIRLITAKNVRVGFLKDEPAEFVPEEVYESWMTRGIPKAGDVLFTTEAPLANVAQLDTDDKVVLGQRLITMQTDPTVTDPGFLKWSLLSPQMQKDIVERGTGATVLGIKASLLKKIPLYVPGDLDQQTRVVHTCEKAFFFRDRLQDQYRKQLADITELRQSLLHQAFTGQLT